MVEIQVMRMGGHLDNLEVLRRAAEQMLGEIQMPNGRRSWGKLLCPMKTLNIYSNKNYNVGKAPFQSRRFKNALTNSWILKLRRPTSTKLLETPKKQDFRPTSARESSLPLATFPSLDQMELNASCVPISMG
jgi:hypothetical protein